ncbi:MAG: hypothetical protein FWG93_05180, partial [Oscillospiraceae bacterium]|nr:hypothetical protein [Oscillospiraceae bacterium]
MAVNGVTNTGYTAPAGHASAKKAAAASTAAKNTVDQTAAKYSDTYEVSKTGEQDSAKKTYSRDTVTLARMKATDDAYLSNLRNLVNQLLVQGGQGQLAGGAGSWQGGIDPANINSYWDLLIDNGDGTFSFHPDLSPEAQNALIAKAQEDIGENGYYGVAQTSQRILDFAKAITGGDPSKIDDMRKMAQKAFDDVAKIMGGWDNLPEVSKQTYEAV